MPKGEEKEKILKEIMAKHLSVLGQDVNLTNSRSSAKPKKII